MDLWQELVTTALVGTEKRSLSLSPPPSSPPLTKGEDGGAKLSNLLSHLNHSDPEEALLSAVAATTLYQQAGRLPVKEHQPLPEPCQPDELPSCSTRAAQHLKLMLRKQQEILLPEWLATAAKARKRVPEHCLPELLDLGQNVPQLRQAISAVLGKRGRWLAAQNPDWNYVVGEDIEQTWITGSRAARQLLLQQLRAENPAAARERVVAIWEQEKPEERFAFIETFQTGLSMADEPFLEATLDDQRKEVRNKAAELLAHLPESRLCQRMRERIRSSITLNQKQNGLQIDFALKEPSNELIKDSSDTKHPRRYFDEQSWKLLQLLQIVAATPLSFWDEINQEPPSHWIRAVQRSRYLQLDFGRVEYICDSPKRLQWTQTLFEGWAIAALRQQNIDWAEAVLSLYGYANRLNLVNGELVSEDQLLQGLIGILPPERRDAFFLNLLQSNNTSPILKDRAFYFLRHHCYPWNAELTRVLIEGIQSNLSGKNNTYNSPSCDYYSLISAFKDCACYMAPCLIPELSTKLAAWLAQPPSLAFYFVEVVDELLALINFRYAMLKGF